ncbi:nephrocystin-1 isoform X1 [Alosa sapidissima]|uniref:nephrocystin-1 isoform X1 n=1 Tax=Alosa sapidissima TaxID=34773 RepID=UPI001C084F71|nr:nephrocystin-1 isoform X1 [Alosa sapidissima]XP_041921374.1 nephrocystin-1 isoform X1 [Alosa sapidissima]
MPPKRRGPLLNLQREADGLKTKLDSLVVDVNQLNEHNRADLRQRCSELLSAVEQTTQALKKLTKADEPAPVGNYELRKREEETRLQDFHNQLRALELNLQSPETSEASERLSTQGPSGDQESEEDSEEEEESEDEDNDDDDDDDDEDEQEQEERNDVKDGENALMESVVAISAFKGEQDGDLTMEKGTVLHILKKNKDGWWLAQDSEGNKGLVPKTYVKAQPLKEVEEEEDEEDDDEEESEEEKEEVDEETKSKARSSHSNWDTVRKAITEIDATDVLSAMGAIPAGFRPSTLSKLLDEGVTYRGSHYIQPELSQSNLSFKDLFLDPDTGKVRARTSRVCLSLSLWSCKMIPPPGVGLQVLSRHVRFCAFDGERVLSNIYTVRATYSPKNPKTWSFSPRMSGQLPSLLDGECFLRCDSASANLGVLFELGVTYIRNSTGERGDLSCGWTFLKLYDANGALIPLRTYELILHGGTPYETDVEVDPSLTKGVTGSVFQQMLMSRRVPKLIVKLRTPNNRTMAHLNLLPDTFVGSLCSVQLLALYRQLLADTLLLDRVTMQSADLICNSVLATFPEVLNQSDLLDSFQSAWENAEKLMKRSEKRDMSVLKREFVRVYMEYVFPLLYSADMPAPLWADDDVDTQRARIVFTSNHNSQSTAQQAFDISQVTYDLLSSARH